MTVRATNLNASKLLYDGVRAYNWTIFIMIIVISTVVVKTHSVFTVNIKQSHYRPGGAQKVPGS
jgi:hypothetical protein